ncbi:MAG TPA: PIN domain-containing protein [Hyphomonadaceae bacterium]|nr:PIN domain-containing protein [Hyphomonadaceae bacterium]
MAGDFFDSNVVIYLVSSDVAKAKQTRALLEGGGIISVQVLNEAVAVLRSKAKLYWKATAEVLEAVRSTCEVASLTEETHDLAFDLAERFQLHIYDASIIAAAKLAECKTLWTEDLTDGQVIEGVRIRNPF